MKTIDLIFIVLGLGVILVGSHQYYAEKPLQTLPLPEEIIMISYCWVENLSVNVGTYIVAGTTTQSEEDWVKKLEACATSAKQARQEYLAWCQPKLHTFEWTDYKRCKDIEKLQNEN